MRRSTVINGELRACSLSGSAAGHEWTFNDREDAKRGPPNGENWRCTVRKRPATMVDEDGSAAGAGHRMRRHRTMLRFYTEVLGLKLVSDAETTPELSTKFGATPHGYRIVRLQTPYGERIKLVQPKRPPVQNAVPEWVYQRQGLSYITFIIDGMTDMVTRLKANDVKFVSAGTCRSPPRGFCTLYAGP